MRPQLQSGLLPPLNELLKIDTPRAPLSLSHSPVLWVRLGSLDARLFDSGGDIQIVSAIIIDYITAIGSTGDCMEHAPEALDDAVFNQGISCPSVESEIGDLIPSVAVTRGVGDLTVQGLALCFNNPNVWMNRPSIVTAHPAFATDEVDVRA